MNSPLDGCSEVADAAGLLGAVMWEQARPADLPQMAAMLAKAKSQVEGALVEIARGLSEPHGLDVLGQHGWASAKDFLTHVTGGHKGAGGGLVRVAEQTEQLPALRDALVAGDVSLPQARAITSKVSAVPRGGEFRSQVAERMLARVVEHGYDATDLDRGFANVVDEVDPDRRLRGEERAKPLVERSAHRARHLSFAEDALGGVRVSGYASLEEAETVKATLMPLAAPQTSEPGSCGGDPYDPNRPTRNPDGTPNRKGCPDLDCFHDGKDPRESGVRMWDALVESCRRLQADDALPHAHGTTARVMVTVSYQHLLDQLGEGSLPGGGTLSASAVRRAACDAEIIPAVLGSESQVLDVGRSQRLVTTAMFLALIVRDQHCAFPGCDRLPLACDAHHITHWADGGATCLDNLVLLCRRHHTVVHHTPWTVHLDANTRRPVWRPPPWVDDRDRFSYAPATRPPPQVALAR